MGETINHRLDYATVAIAVREAAEHVELLVDKLELTHRELAVEIGTSTTALRAFRRDPSKSSTFTLLKILDWLGRVDMDGAT